MWTQHHKCPPIWYVWCPEDGEERGDARKIFATDPDDAAEKWAELDDSESSEYRIVGGRDIHVCVQKDGLDVVHDFVVEGESVPQYNAKMISKHE
jgi:hypothetical protein